MLADVSSLATPLIDLAGLAGHRQVPDFHLVNLVANHKAVLVTFDRAISKTLTPADQRLVTVLS